MHIQLNYAFTKLTRLKVITFVYKTCQSEMNCDLQYEATVHINNIWTKFGVKVLT